ncbi:MAG TPA: hypothetical protein PKK06_13970 [Phycisphaerae bacterium]|nr:hypothetical protein [Phycisphaerae bacterium]HNU46396.1 hypothetical protein [Phycisphaerae bacterium]
MPRVTPPSLTALGRGTLPPRIDIRGHTYAYARTFKNDFFAVTALYVGQDGKVVLKVGRQVHFLGLPMRWIGRWLRQREERFLRLLADVDGVPRLLARWSDTGLVRTFIEGRPLRNGEPVADDFHPRLQALVATLHRRGVAYVDLEKCGNVIVGEDGKPYLIDFQISWIGRPGWLHAWPPLSWVARWFQGGDRYHLVKLQRRTRPDQLSPECLAASYCKPWYVRTHRALTQPLQRLRRAVLERVDPRRARGERGHLPEDDSDVRVRPGDADPHAQPLPCGGGSDRCRIAGDDEGET